jgi:hypothetical protein
MRVVVHEGAFGPELQRRYSSVDADAAMPPCRHAANYMAGTIYATDATYKSYAT